MVIFCLHAESWVEDCWELTSIFIFLVQGGMAVCNLGLLICSLIPSFVFPDWECRAGNETTNE